MCSVARGRGKCAPELPEPPRSTAPRAPAHICRGRLCRRISEQGPASRRRASVVARPPAGSLCCGHTSKEAPALQQGPGVEVWPPRRSVRGQPSPRPQSPPCPAPRAQHRASASPLLPARPVGRQTFPRLVQAPGSPAQPDPRGTALGAPTCAHAALRSRRLQQVSHRAPDRAPQPRPPPLQPLLALPLPGKPPPPPSRQPTSTIHMAPHSQWATSPFRSPSRVPSPFPG